jgi:hypothetical protein
MARIRTIKPETPQSESMGRLTRDEQLVFILLWTVADDEGKARAASRMLASTLFPYHDDAADKMDGWLGALEREDMIRRYQIEGSTYLQITNWLKHQKIDKPSKSRFPTFDESSRLVAKPREGSASDLGPRTLDQDLGPGPSTKEIPVASQPSLPVRQRASKISNKELDAEFDVWFPQFPNPNGPDAARRSYRSVRRSSRATAAELLQSVMRYSQEKTGTDPTYIKTAKNWLNDGDWKNPPRARPANGSLLNFDDVLEDYVDGVRHG